VEVRDTGCGIEPEYIGKVFDKFAQVEARKDHKSYSTGLGLTFCKLAVESHGGAIGVSSEVGQGSTFWFELPGKASS
jgi:signal transduction histidine kinase